MDLEKLSPGLTVGGLLSMLKAIGFCSSVYGKLEIWSLANKN